MNILFIGYHQQFFYQAKLLVDAGHNAYIATGVGTGTLDEYSLSIGAVGVIKEPLPAVEWTVENCTWITDAITAHSITHVINGLPWVSFIGDMMPAGVVYLGPTAAANELETNKFATRAAVSALGLQTSPVLLEGSSANIATDLTTCTERPIVVKPKTVFQNAIILQAGEEAALTSRLGGEDAYDYYFERFIPNLVTEGYAYFVIANGQWAITSTGSVGGEATTKGVIPAVTSWMGHTTTAPLSSDDDTAVRAFAGTFLDMAKTKGGNYEGELYVGIDNAGLVHWIEVSSRPSSPNVAPTFCSAAEYIQSLTSDPSIIASAWPANFKYTDLVAAQAYGSVYPYDLHATHSVPKPVGLTKVGTTYYLNHAGLRLFSEGDLPSAFVTAINASGTCTIS
jgi:hypothetical protein